MLFPTVFKYRIAWRNLLIMLLLGGVFSLFPLKPVQAATWTVCAGGCNYTTIQAAINAAGTINGDTITVMSAVHTEFNVNITKNLTIQGLGSGSTIVQANVTPNHSLNRRVFFIPAGLNVTLQDMTLRHGDITSGLGGGAIAVAGGGTLTLNRAVVTNNRSLVGGGGIRSDGTMTINDSTISNNTASGAWGGAIDNNFGGTMTINNSTINNNVASVGNGGGLDNYGSTQTTRAFINNSTFSNNVAAGSGGGIYNRADGGTSTVTLSHVTVTNNTVNTGNGGGIFSEGTNVRYIEFRNTVIANNIDNGGQAPDCSGSTLTSLNYNLIENLVGCTIGGTTTNNLTGVDPNLGALANNGGPTQTHALLVGSQAINHIPNGINGCGTTYSNDQRGVVRPQNSSCDIGAYELVIAVSPGINGGNGPGGVGTADGTDSLRLWLQADRGITTSPIAAWNDQSGYNNHAIQNTAGNRPVWQNAVWNNQPAVRFDGVNDLLELPFILNPTNANGYTIVIVNQMANLSVHNTFVQQLGATGRGLLGTLPSPNFSYYSFLGGAWRVASTALSTNTPYLVTSTWTGGASGTLVIYLDQVADGTFAATAESATGTWRLGANKTGGLVLNGDMGDVIVFEQVLNELERILVDNYLSSKYAITLPIAANDHYDGDTPANGDFEQNVAGIGQFGGNQHTQAHSAGMIVVNNTFLNENGDWLLFGHRTVNNSNSAADLPTGGDWDGVNDVRWARHWYVDVTDPSVNNGTVDIIFDFSEAGMNGGQPPSSLWSNYRLLKRTGSTGQFSDITTLSGATVVVVGDQIQFQGVDVAQLGSNFTLGSIDGTASPTAITTQNVASQISQPTYLALILLLLVLLAITIKVVWRRIV